MQAKDNIFSGSNIEAVKSSFDFGRHTASAASEVTMLLIFREPLCCADENVFLSLMFAHLGPCCLSLVGGPQRLAIP